LADLYDAALANLGPLVLPIPREAGSPGWHLYQVLIDFEAAGVSRGETIRRLHASGIAAQVHYIPLYRQPVFKARYGEKTLPGAEAFYSQVLALPLFPAMADQDVAKVAAALTAALG
jgi:dTDP-4-amino-4,6-dideoxygalactose transaminase